jgi:hypothetical protein
MGNRQIPQLRTYGMKTFVIWLLTASGLMSAGSASAQLSQNWTLAQCQKAWGRGDKRRAPSVYIFKSQVINNVEVSPSAMFSGNVIVSARYDKDTVDDFTQDEAINFLLENAPDVIWSKEVHPNSNSESKPEWGLLFWIGIDKLSGEVKYSASTSEGRHGTAILEINRGTKAELWFEDK